MISVLTRLYHKEAHGKGQLVNAQMLEALLSGSLG